MKYLYLLLTFCLTGCNPMDNGVRFEAKDIQNLCEQQGKGHIDSQSFQIGLNKGLFGDSITITQTCIRDK